MKTKGKKVQDVSKISNIRWDRYYAKKQHELADKIAKGLSRSKIEFDAKIPMAIAKILVFRKNKSIKKS